MKRTTLAALAAGALVFAALTLGESSSVKAGDWGFSFGFHSPPAHFGYHHFPHHHHYHGHHFYHGPSFHYDRVYHPDYYHWTPDIGFHSHGHYDLIPHYTPGHFHHHHFHH